MKLVCLLLASVFSFGASHPSGADVKACTTLRPDHTLPNDPTPLPPTLTNIYELVNVNRGYFLPGYTLTIRLIKKDGASEVYGKFKGLMLRSCYHTNANPEVVVDYGSFQLSDDDEYRYMGCGKDGALSESYITHTNRDEKDVGVEFVWKAPDDACMEDRVYFISGTVVHEFAEYQLGLRVYMACNNFCHKTPKPEAVIPRAATSNFNSGKFSVLKQTKQRDGWWNIYYEEACQFTHERVDATNFKLAHSPKFDDRTYLALLRSPYSFQGCMCFQFRCRMSTNKPTGSVRLSLLTDGGQRIFSTTITGSEWVKTRKSIVTGSEKATFLFVSENNDGVVELDDFKFSGGLCDPEEPESALTYVN